MIVRSALGALLVVGCGGGRNAVDAGPPQVELGTGDSEFEAIADGDDIFIVQGPQGGYHFFGSVRARNLEPGDVGDLSSPDNPTVEFQAFQGQERIDIGASSYTQGLSPSPEGDEMIGRTVILDIADDAELEGAMVSLQVEIRDVNGRSASDARNLIAVPHPNNL